MKKIISFLIVVLLLLVFTSITTNDISVPERNYKMEEDTIKVDTTKTLKVKQQIFKKRMEIQQTKMDSLIKVKKEKGEN